MLVRWLLRVGLVGATFWVTYAGAVQVILMFWKSDPLITGLDDPEEMAQGVLAMGIGLAVAAFVAVKTHRLTVRSDFAEPGPGA